MKKYITLFCLSAFFFVDGCNIICPKPDKVAGIDIEDAWFLGVEDSQQGASTSNNLVKLTSSDISTSPDPLFFLDDDGRFLGDNFAQIEAHHIITLTENYILLFGAFTFTLYDGEHYSNALIVNTESGAVYDLENRYFPDWTNWYMGSMYHQTDADGNIYYKYGGVSRLVIGDDESITYENYMDYYEGFYDSEAFFVDRQGNIFFNNGELVKLASGGIIESGENLLLINSHYKKVIGFTGMDYPNQKAYYITFEDGEIRKELIVENLKYTESFYDTKLYSNDEELAHFIFTPSQGIEHNEEITHILGLAIFEEDSIVYNMFLANDLEISAMLGIEDHYLWIQSGIELYAIDIDSYSLNSEDLSLTLNKYTQFDIPQGYELQQVRFDRKGMVEFIAYNFNEEKRGKGFISMAHGFEFIDDDSDLGSVELTRIR